MKKLDEEELRAGLNAAWDTVPIPPEEGSHREKVLLLKRAKPVLVELGVFLSAEMIRNDDNLMQGISNIAEVVATAVATACEGIEDADPVPKGQMTAAHKAIHVFVDGVDRELHSIHYDREDGKGATVTHAQVPMKFKEVGDA
jgi:hypothetical protein